MSQYPPGQPPMNYATPPLEQGKPAGLAVTAMVLGIISVVLFCLWYLSVPCALLAIIFGALALGKAKRGEGGGAGMAKTGLILGIISIALVILFYILAVAFSVSVLNWAHQVQQQQQQQMQHNGATNPSGLLHLHLQSVLNLVRRG